MADTDRARKSSIISALVHQMKNGQISKSDLFEQLSRLQRGSKVAEPEGGGDNRPGAGGAAQSERISCFDLLPPPHGHWS